MIQHYNQRCTGLCRRAAVCLLPAFYIFLGSCQPEKKELQLQQMWRRPVFESHTETAESIYPVQAGDRVLTAKLLDGVAPTFYALDVKPGRILWQLTDTVCTGKVYYNLRPFVSKQGICLPCGKTTMCVDTKIGKRRWVSEQAGHPEQILEPCTNSTFLQSVNDWDGRQSYIQEVSSIDGDTKPIYAMKWQDSTKLLIRTPVKVNNELLLFTSIEMQYGTNETVAKWLLLKRSTGEIFSEGRAYSENKSGYGVTKQPVLVGDRAFMVAYDNVFCISTTDGKELWRTALPRDMLTSMPVASKEGLFCPMEDGYVYKLDLDSGKIVWKAKISATPSRPVIIKDLMFIVGGSDGILYVVSTQDGKVVKSLKAPNHHFIHNQFFRRFIGTDSDGEWLILFDGNSFRGYKVWN